MIDHFTQRRFVFTSLFVLCLLSIIARARADAVGYRFDAAHDGDVTMNNFSAIPVPIWSTQIVNEGADYPLIVQDSVILENNVNGVNSIESLTAETGATNWVTSIAAIGGGPPPAYDNGKLFFTSNFSSSSGLMTAFNVQTGATVWSTPLPGQYVFTSPNTALNGSVYTAGSGGGGTFYAVRQSDGQLLWNQSVENGDTSSPVVTSTNVYASYVGPQIFAFNPSNGVLNWRYKSGVEGGGGMSPILSTSTNTLFVGDNFFGGVLAIDATTGAVKYQLNTDDSMTAPAFSSTTGYYDFNGILNAFDPNTGDILWTLQPDGKNFVTAPVLVNGVLYDGTSDGTLYALDASDGSAIGSISVGGNFDALGLEDYQADLTASNGILIAQTSDGGVHVFAIPEPSSAIILSAAALVALRRRPRRT